MTLTRNERGPPFFREQRKIPKCPTRTFREDGKKRWLYQWIRRGFFMYTCFLCTVFVGTGSGCHCQCPHHRQQGGSNFINGKKPSPRSGANKRMKTSTRRAPTIVIFKSHVLHVWNIYLHLSVNFRLKGSHSADFDDLVRQLLPMTLDQSIPWVVNTHR